MQDTVVTQVTGERKFVGVVVPELPATVAALVAGIIGDEE